MIGSSSAGLPDDDTFSSCLVPKPGSLGNSKNVAGWSSPVAREAHNLEVTGSNPVPATFFTPAGPSMAPAGCFLRGARPPAGQPCGVPHGPGRLFFCAEPGLQPGSPTVCRIHGPGGLFFALAPCRGTPNPSEPAVTRLATAGSVVWYPSLPNPGGTCCSAIRAFGALESAPPD